MNTEAYKTALIATAEREAAEYRKTGKITGEFQEAVEAFIDNEGAYDIIAMLLLDAPKGDIRSKMEEVAFSDWRVEREIERNESIANENRADARRYEESMAA